MNTLALAEKQILGNQKKSGLVGGVTIKHLPGMHLAVDEAREAFATTVRNHATTKAAWEFLASKPLTEKLKTAFLASVFRHPGPDGADTSLKDITAEAILAARAKMQKDDNSSNSTINGKVSTLKKILNMAHRKGWVAMASWRDVPPLRITRDPVQYWNAEQVAVAFSVARGDSQPGRAILMLVLGIFLGLRKNEAVHLRWCDMVLDRIHPRTRMPSPICMIQQRAGFSTKTYENRKIPISAEGVRLLREHRPVDAHPEDYILVAERHHEKRGGTKRVYRYDPVKVWNRVLKGAKAKGNHGIEFKEMRHSFACNCLQTGHSVEKVARWLGHKDPRMVRQHYAFLLDYDDDTGLKFLGDEE